MLNKSQTAKAAGINLGVFSFWESKGLLPPPDLKTGKALFYLPETVAEIKAIFDAGIKPNEAIAKKKDYLSRADLTRLLGIGDNTIKKMIEFCFIPAPNKREGRREFWAADLLPAIKSGLGEYSAYLEGSPKRYSDDRKRAGFYSSLDVAEMSGVRAISIQYRQKTGAIPMPSHRYRAGPYRYYDTAETKKIVKFFEDRKPIRCGPGMKKGTA